MGRGELNPEKGTVLSCYLLWHLNVTDFGSIYSPSNYTQKGFILLKLHWLQRERVLNLCPDSLYFNFFRPWYPNWYPVVCNFSPFGVFRSLDAIDRLVSRSVMGTTDCSYFFDQQLVRLALWRFLLSTCTDLLIFPVGG